MRVGFRNVCNPVGVYPVANVERVRDMLASMDFHYVFLPSVIEATLYNPNLRVHTVGAVTSIPRIENPGETNSCTGRSGHPASTAFSMRWIRRR